jgi:hypothetical protein
MRILFSILCSLAMATSAGATTLLKMSMNDMIVQSTEIVRARVVGSRTAAIGQDIYTYYQLAVAESLKGASVPAEVAVPGGVYGRLRQVAVGSPALTEGQEYVLFLWTNQRGMSQLIGLSQGMFRLTEDASGAKVLSRGAIADPMVDKAGKPVTDQGVAMKWSDLKAQIVKTLKPAVKK